ncbi:MAG TPA: sialidase family protein, partial [Thermoplasmata archaeon]|nr:sialidase family protein [Thermoplasmata archaeon]
MTDGMNQSTRTTSRPLRTIRAAALVAIAVAVLMALPLPALAGSSPYLGTAPAPIGHAVVAHSTSHANAPASVGALPPAIEQILGYAKHDPSALRATLTPHASGAFSPALLSAAATSAALAASRPAGLSGNTYLGASCASGSTVSAINGTNSTLLAGLSSLYLLFNGTGGSLCNTGSSSTASVLQHGFLEMERSTNGGATWTPNWLPQNASWTNPSSPLNGSVVGAWIPITSLNQPPYASPSIASWSNGTVLVGTQFMPGCWLIGACTATTSLDPAGIAVARSTDGGTSWSKMAVIESKPYFQNITPTGACVGVLQAGDYNDFMPYSPTIAVNPSTNNAIAAWEQFQLGIVMTSAACSLFVFGTVQVSTSSDGGVTWSAPVNVSGNESYNPQIAVGPGPAYTDTLVWQSWLNATVDNTTGAFGANWAVATSANNGGTWTTPVDTTTAPGSVALLSRAASSPDTFAVTNQPYPLLVAGKAGFAVDNWSTSAHAGNEYIVWADNQTPGATDQGFARIAFQEHVSGGSGWSTISYLTPATRSTAYLEPSVSVAPDGAVWVTFYGLSESSGDLTTWAVYSTNGGSTWSTLSEISSASSVLPVGLLSIGDYMGLVGTSAGAFATWMDCRMSSCTGAVNTTVVGSLVEPVALTSNITGVNLTVTTNGASQTVALPGGEAWAVGTNHTLSAPGWFPHNSSTVSSFLNYTGAVNSSSFTVTFDYTGGAGVVANYVFVPGAFIAGTFSPNTPQSHLTIDGAVVTLTPVNATTESFNYSVASGRTYYVNATASNLYQSLLNDPVGVQSGHTTVLTINLQKTVGWLTGRVTPVNATLLLNGAPVSINATNGVYNVTEQWGSYWLNATGYG